MVTYPTTPVLIDLFLTEFNSRITTLLPWLDNPLGQITEIGRHLDAKYVKVPAMHTDSGEYIDVLPDDKLVNYSWWHFEPLQLKGKFRAKVKTTARFNMFLDLRKLYPNDLNSRNAQNIIFEIERVINKIGLKSAALRISSFSTDPKDAYRGFNVSSIDDKYFMHPYLTLSLKVDVYIRNNVCGTSTVVFLDTDTPGIDIDENYKPTGKERIMLTR